MHGLWVWQCKFSIMELNAIHLIVWEFNKALTLLQFFWIFFLFLLNFSFFFSLLKTVFHNMLYLQQNSKTRARKRNRVFATSLHHDGVFFWYFKLRLFDRAELKAWNIKGLWNWVSKIKGDYKWKSEFVAMIQINNN